MNRKMIVSVAVLCALLAMPFTSNTGNAAKSAGKGNPAASPGPAQPDEVETSDDRLAAVAKQVPGFGGMFFNRDGTLQVYLLLTIGELCLGPIGFSTVSGLAPTRMLGLMMGVCFLSISLGNYVAGWVAGFFREGTIVLLFDYIALTTILAGVALGFLSNYLRKLMNISGK